MKTRAFPMSMLCVTVAAFIVFAFPVHAAQTGDSVMQEDHSVCSIAAAKKAVDAMKAARHTYLDLKRTAAALFVSAIQAAKDARAAAITVLEETYTTSQDAETMRAQRRQALRAAKAARAAARSARDAQGAAAKSAYTAALKEARETWRAEKAACALSASASDSDETE